MAPDPPDLAGIRRPSRLVQVPRDLQVEPELRLHPEHLLEAQRGVGRHTALAVHNLVQPRIGDPNPFGELCLANTERLDELLEQHFARMSWRPILRKEHETYIVSGSRRSQPRRDRSRSR